MANDMANVVWGERNFAFGISFAGNFCNFVKIMPGIVGAIL